MASLIPQFDTINQFEFYDLSTKGWLFENTKEAIDNNRPIIKSISENFSELFKIPFEEVIKAFDTDYIYTRSTENLLLIYTSKDSDNVQYYFINKNSDTFKTLKSL